MLTVTDNKTSDITNNYTTTITTNKIILPLYLLLFCFFNLVVLIFCFLQNNHLFISCFSQQIKIQRCRKFADRFTT